MRVSKLPIYLKRFEVVTLLAAPEDLRDRLILRLLYCCAMRVSEACGLRIEDVDPVDRIIKVCHAWTPSGLPKGGRERLVPVDPETVGLIMEYAGDRITGRLLKISPRQAQRVVRKYAVQARIRDPSRVTPHKLRHSFAVHWIRRRGGLERLRRILGHKSLETTQIYLQLRFEDVKEEYNRVMGVMA